MADESVSERVEAEPVGSESGNVAFRLADHWIVYTLIISLAVAIWFNLLYFLFVWLGWTGAASFFR